MEFVAVQDNVVAYMTIRQGVGFSGVENLIVVLQMSADCAECATVLKGEYFSATRKKTAHLCDATHTEKENRIDMASRRRVWCSADRFVYILFRFAH